MKTVPVPVYTKAAKAFHWTIVLLLVVQFLTAVLMPEIDRDVVPSTLISLHFSIGLLIVVVMGIRLIYRLQKPVPLEAAGTPRWELWTARATHRIFYFILLIGPFLGWASASAHNLPVNLFGVIPLPSIAPFHARWALSAGDVHALMMWILLCLAFVHAAAALFHHFIRHDDVLRRMLPMHDD